jgi:hypothetical protein
MEVLFFARVSKTIKGPFSTPVIINVGRLWPKLKTKKKRSYRKRCSTLWTTVIADCKHQIMPKTLSKEVTKYLTRFKASVRSASHGFSPLKDLLL